MHTARTLAAAALAALLLGCPKSEAPKPESKQEKVSAALAHAAVDKNPVPKDAPPAIDPKHFIGLTADGQKLAFSRPSVAAGGSVFRIVDRQGAVLRTEVLSSEADEVKVRGALSIDGFVALRPGLPEGREMPTLTLGQDMVTVAFGTRKQTVPAPLPGKGELSVAGWSASGKQVVVRMTAPGPENEQAEGLVVLDVP